MNYTRRALLGAFWVFIFLIVSAAAGYLLRLLLAKKLDIADYGLFYAVFAVIQLLIIFRDIGLRNALAKFIPEFLAKKRKGLVKGSIAFAFYVHFATSLIFTAALIALAPFLAKSYFHTLTATNVVMLFSIVFLASFVEEIFVYALQGYQMMLWFSITPALRMTMVLIITITLLWLGAGLLAPVIAFLVTYAILSVLYAALFVRGAFRDFFRTKAEVTMALAKKMTGFGFLTMLTLAGGFILVYTDTIVLTYFRSLKEVGLYQAAMPTTTLLWYLTQAMSAIILPMASELLAKNKRRVLKAGIELSHRYAVAAVVPLALAMIAFPEIILKVLFGEGYVSAAPAMQILAAGAIVYSISTLNTAALSGIGKPEITTRIIFIAAVLNLALNLALIPAYGIVGAAIATAISYLAMALLSTIKLMHYTRIREPWINWAKTAIGGAVFVAVVFVLKNQIEANVWLEMAVCLIAAGAVYLMLLFLLGIISPEELNEIKKRAFSRIQ